ncbi:hypothetical protein KR51_00013600 [Rubidibacter lacunae KORDI 51-2]|uniref:vWA-MoxR associated protein N-terminal HTH domain-containing protein n=2 Tax=Rubidibacter TaxID=582491 RepID=U5DK15_9CHRO|nr:hypothetical protein KR51_00013600 [Rubidibacter lacunae KORDI 51-2]
MEFTIDEAIKVANQVVFDKIGRNLTDVEIWVLEGSWERLDYDRIAARNQYAASYISQDVAPKLWRLLSEALGERVKKSNFREALKRAWDQRRIPITPVSPRALKLAPLEPVPSTPLSPSLYVERPPLESLCYDALLHPGALVRVKAPSLMGKTSLVERVLAQLSEQGYRTVGLSFELAERRTHFDALDRFLRWFCLNLTRELGLPIQLEDYWDSAGMGSKVSCTTYFEEYLLAQSDSPLVLCLDDVDLLFPYPVIYEDFFGLLRSWYEKGRSRKIWKRLRLAIVHSTDVYIRLNINQSPFNVGLPIELTEFTPEQVEEFANLHDLELDAAQIGVEGLALLMEHVGGHPYLIEQALSHLKGHPHETLGHVLDNSPTEAGIYANHLREYLIGLQQVPELANACQRVMAATTPVKIDPVHAYQLQSMGLVRLLGNEVEPRCYLYRTYFRDRLGEFA